VRRIAGPRGDERRWRRRRAGPWTLRDSQGNEVGKGETRLGSLGGFDLLVKLPPTMNLGQAVLQLEAVGGPLAGQHAHGFQVQEFRRPEFEVKAAASEGPFLVGGAVTVTVAPPTTRAGRCPGPR
jgi:hypothetical protein